MRNVLSTYDEEYTRVALKLLLTIEKMAKRARGRGVKDFLEMVKGEELFDYWSERIPNAKKNLSDLAAVANGIGEYINNLRRRMYQRGRPLPKGMDKHFKQLESAYESYKRESKAARRLM